jgi:hypothetical protein
MREFLSATPQPAIFPAKGEDGDGGSHQNWLAPWNALAPSRSLAGPSWRGPFCLARSAS